MLLTPAQSSDVNPPTGVLRPETRGIVLTHFLELGTIRNYMPVMGVSAEDRTMASSHSVTRWLEQLK
jgi:hypothetical protein